MHSRMKLILKLHSSFFQAAIIQSMSYSIPMSPTAHFSIAYNYLYYLIKKLFSVEYLENTFSKFDTFSNELFFDGQIWDAHSLLLDIFNSSKENIVIIDNYISKELLDVLCKTNKQIIVYTKNIDKNLIINDFRINENKVFFNLIIPHDKEYSIEFITKHLLNDYNYEINIDRPYC